MIAALLIGLGAAALLLAAIMWSILVPDRRIWPPTGQPSLSKQIVVWTLTVMIFASAAFLGAADWNRLDWPTELRWFIGLPLIVIGNIIVWLGVAQIGMEATSGEATGLHTGGLYRFSRNPQYLADMGILVGWQILTASLWTLPITVSGIVLLALTPLSEEPWLEEAYGDEYKRYRTAVRRFL